MNLRDYIKAERGNATRLAEKLGVSLSYLSQLAGSKGVAPERAVDIERFTDGVVARPDLRPDDWQRIWPELIPAVAVPGTPGGLAALPVGEVISQEN